MTTSRDSLSQLSESAVNNNVTIEEPQVFVGIFPASHCQIRERLEDSERNFNPATISSRFNDPNQSRSQKGSHMETLPEEEEYSEHPSGQVASPVLTSTPILASVPKVLTATDGRRLSNLSSPAPASHSHINQTSSRLPPPLPSLKCGDETLSGGTEPLIDEIACALREWTNLLYFYLLRRDYKLFSKVRQYIETLQQGRKNLLGGNLSSRK